MYSLFCFAGLVYDTDAHLAKISSLLQLSQFHNTAPPAVPLQRCSWPRLFGCPSLPVAGGGFDPTSAASPVCSEVLLPANSIIHFQLLLLTLLIYHVFR